MKRIQGIMIFSLILIYVIVVFGFITDQRKKVVCKNVELVYTDSTNVQFIDKDDVLTILNKKYRKINGLQLDSLYIEKIERILRKLPVVKDVNVYTKIDCSVIIEIQQRTPILRFINDKGENYYIDRDGDVIPVSHKAAFKVLVVNGNIKESFPVDTVLNVKRLTKKEVILQRNILYDLYTFKQELQKNQFCSSLIEQIYVNDNNEIELVPRIGNFIILLGDADDCEQKLCNLEIMYRNGFNNAGWNKYKYVNLKFKNQVVCTKRH